METYARNFLRKRAHNLSPIVFVGKQGSDERVIKALDEALANHELIKVKFVDYKSQRRELAADMAKKTSAELISVIGNIAILFREHEEPSERRYHIPKR